MPKTLMLIDGNNLGFRGFGQAPLTWNGLRTEVIFLGLKQVLYYMREHHPSEVMICWDGGHDTRRTIVFPDYKKKRELTPEERAELVEFYRQLDNIRRVFHSLGLRQVRIRGRETDDIIYTLVTKKPLFASDFDEFLIVSTDWDYFQLLQDPKVKVFSPIKGEMIGLSEAKKLLGFDDMGQYPFWKAVIGGHDAIPGIHGVGPKAATFFINNKGTPVEQYPLRFKNLWAKVAEAQDQVALWTKLSEFFEVDEREIADNTTFEPQRNYIEWCRKAMGVLEEFGFREFKDNFIDFSSPWQDYYQSVGGTHG